MIAFLVVVADAIAIWLFVRGVRARNAWPAPIPRPHVCDRCWRAYRSSHYLTLHTNAEHPNPFEDP